MSSHHVFQICEGLLAGFYNVSVGKRNADSWDGSKRRRRDTSFSLSCCKEDFCNITNVNSTVQSISISFVNFHNTIYYVSRPFHSRPNIKNCNMIIMYIVPTRQMSYYTNISVRMYFSMRLNQNKNCFNLPAECMKTSVSFTIFYDSNNQ